jgi:excisionase family DNA binding protein
MRLLNVRQAAEYASCHPETVRDALRSGELAGTQRKKGGAWKTTTAALDAWAGVEAIAA